MFIREFNEERFEECVSRVLMYDDMAAAGLPDPEYQQTEFMLCATLKNKNWGKENVSWTSSDTSEGVSDEACDEACDEAKLLAFCSEPKSKAEIREYMGIKSERYIRQTLIMPLLEKGSLQ